MTATENLLATKCNLCAGTSLNPPGAKSEAFSCQENCPTGALVRVNPREYFAEVNGRIGLVFRDQTHAIGRNIHRRDPFATALARRGGVAGPGADAAPSSGRSNASASTRGSRGRG